MLWVSFLPSTSDDAWAYIRILPGLVMIGIGMGIGFPSLNVGAMGAVTGQDLGLASGVLNTARQLGAAIGVAILIATFGGALHAHMSWFADEEIEDIVDDWEIPAPLAGMVIQSTLHDYTGGTAGSLRARAGLRRGDHPRDRRLGPRGLRLGVPPGGDPGAVRAAADGGAAPDAGAGARGGDGGGGRPGAAAGPDGAEGLGSEGDGDGARARPGEARRRAPPGLARPVLPTLTPAITAVKSATPSPDRCPRCPSLNEPPHTPRAAAPTPPATPTRSRAPARRASGSS